MKLPAFDRFMVNQTLLSMKASYAFHSPGVQLGMVNKDLVDKELNAQSAAIRQGPQNEVNDEVVCFLRARHDLYERVLHGIRECWNRARGSPRGADCLC